MLKMQNLGEVEMCQCIRKTTTEFLCIEQHFYLLFEQIYVICVDWCREVLLEHLPLTVNDDFMLSVLVTYSVLLEGNF